MQVTAPETGNVLSPVRPELAGLVQPDGTVVVPAAVAAEVLRLLVFALTERARGTGGVPTPAARALLPSWWPRSSRQPPRQRPRRAGGRSDASPGRVRLPRHLRIASAAAAWCRDGLRVVGGVLVLAAGVFVPVYVLVLVARAVALWLAVVAS